MNWIIDRDNIHRTTIVKYDLQEIELPFHISVDDFSTPAEIARLIVQIYQAGFNTGYEAKEFDNEDALLHGMLGEDY